jgi:hypothetical protein
VVISYRSIKSVSFPVFMIPSSNWQLTDGLLFIDEKLVDDRNMPGETLGRRRIQTHYKELLVLKKALWNLTGILKQSSNTFIDSLGKTFIYEKTIMCPLKYFKIEEVILKETASLIRVKGLPKPFTVPRPPASGMQWVGILHYRGLPWLLYEYSEEKLKDTRRKV